MSLGRETHHPADRPDDLGGQGMGPMPKISMRLVPEASTSASMRSFRSAIFRSSARTSRMISEANRRRTRAEQPCARMPRRMRAARGVESVPATPPGTRSRRSPCRRLNARVRSATKSSRLSESRRSTSEPASGSTMGNRSLRQAASAVARASSPSFFRALPLESTRTRAESLGCSRPPPTRRPLPTSLPGAYPEATSVLHRPTTLAKAFCPALEGSQAFSRFCGKLAHSMSSPAPSFTAATATDALWGSTPMSTSISAHTSVPVGSLCHYWRA